MVGFVGEEEFGWAAVAGIPEIKQVHGRRHRPAVMRPANSFRSCKVSTNAAINRLRICWHFLVVGPLSVSLSVRRERPKVPFEQVAGAGV